MPGERVSPEHRSEQPPNNSVEIFRTNVPDQLNGEDVLLEPVPLQLAPVGHLEDDHGGRPEDGPILRARR